MAIEVVVAMMSLDDRVLHFCGYVHGVALCGAEMRDPWWVGPIAHIYDRATTTCQGCYDQVVAGC